MAKSSMTSVVIPAYNEPHLSTTVDNIFANASSAIEVIVVLDGYWPEGDAYPTERDGLVIISHGERRGMRAAINTGARAATGKYLMKCDAHCIFSPGFDAAMAGDCEADRVLVPRRYWIDEKTWEPRVNKLFEFQYIERGTLKGRDWKEYGERVGDDQLLVELMTMQGSCWFMRRAFFFDTLGGLDEDNYGGMGREAQEVCLKTWLSGGSLMLTRRAWYGHWNKPKQWVINDRAGKAKSVSYAQDVWAGDGWPKWPGAIHGMDWLVARFAPVPSWNGDGANNIRVGAEPKEEQKKAPPVQEEAAVRPYLENKYGMSITDDMESPIIVPGMNRRKLYEMFADVGLRRGCEIGVQRGRNAKVMVDVIPDLELYLVDPYEDCDWGNRTYGSRHHEKMMGMALKRFVGNDKVKLLRMYSADAVRRFEDGYFDFVYIDGMHLYDFVMQDQILWSRKVRPGGIVAGHDYVNRGDTIGVMYAVDDYTRRHGIWPMYITDRKAHEAKGDKCPSWFYINPTKDEITGRVKFCGRA